MTSAAGCDTEAMKLLALAVAPLLAAAAQETGPPEIDPADFPEPLRPYLEPALELEGLEMSLTLSVGLSLGMASEQAELPAEFSAAARVARGNWNDILEGAVEAALEWEGDGHFGGSLYYDTGTEISKDRRTAEVLRDPEFRLVHGEDTAEVILRRRLVHGMRAGLTEDDASKLLERLRAATANRREFNPWLTHARSHAMFMSMGAFEDYARDMEESGTPFGTWDEFQARVIAETAKVLIAPLRAKLPEDEAKGRRFRHEGEFVVQLCDPKATTWAAPEELLAANAADASPILLIQVARPVEKAEGKRTAARSPKAIRIGMVAGGELRELHDGPFPLPDPR